MLGVLLAVTGCGGVRPGDIALTSESQDAVILMQALPSPAPYMLNLASYNPGAQQAQNGLWDAGSTIRMRSEANSGPDFIVQTVKPGAYVIHSFSKQGHWTLCFNRETYYFKVEPGQLVYLGAFDPKPHLQELQGHVARNGDFTARGSQVFHYLDNVWLPSLFIPSDKEESLRLARKYVSVSMPKVTTPIQPVVYQKTSFRTGASLLGQKLCGGYYNDQTAQKAVAQ
jgi:hypothetical protein